MEAVRDVAASAEVAWEVACDTRRYAEWVPVTLEVLETDGPAELGSTYKERDRALGPIKSTSEWTVIEFEPPRRQLHRTESIPILKPLDVEMVVEELGGQSSQFTLRWKGQTALGPIGAIAVRLQRSSFRRDLEATADSMAAAFEAAPTQT